MSKEYSLSIDTVRGRIFDVRLIGGLLRPFTPDTRKGRYVTVTHKDNLPGFKWRGTLADIKDGWASLHTALKKHLYEGGEQNYYDSETEKLVHVHTGLSFAGNIELTLAVQRKSKAQSIDTLIDKKIKRRIKNAEGTRP